MRRRVPRRVVALALAALGAACSGEKLEVADDKGASVDDYGHAALLAISAEMGKAPTSAAAYRQMVTRIDAIRPRFNDRVAAAAELQLAFLAIGPLAAQLDAEPEAQLAELATTVWPTAFAVEPTAGETPRAYLARVCSGKLAAECKYVVPEAWPLVMSAKVWRRMKGRAREALGNCSLCKLDPSYDRVLEDYERHDTELQAKVRTLGDRANPSFWPRAGGEAAPWSGAPVLELGADTVTLDGEAMADDEWRRLLAERRAGRTALAVHLRPRQETRVLRAALVDAARAGWTSVALQARSGTYPFELREYTLSTRGRGPSVDVRDVDSIQVLVQALDAAVTRQARRGGAPAPLRL